MARRKHGAATAHRHATRDATRARDRADRMAARAGYDVALAERKRAMLLLERARRRLADARAAGEWLGDLRERWRTALQAWRAAGDALCVARAERLLMAQSGTHAQAIKDARGRALAEGRERWAAAQRTPDAAPEPAPGVALQAPAVAAPRVVLRLVTVRKRRGRPPRRTGE